MEDAVEELKTLQRVVAPDHKIITTNHIKQVCVIYHHSVFYSKLFI